MDSCPACGHSLVARDEPGRLATPDLAVELLRPKLERLAKESFFVVALDTKGQALGMKRVAVGTWDCCPVDPRLVFSYALSRPRVAAIIVAHNHPSGDPTPSRLDITLTGQLERGAMTLGLRLLDHLVIARGGKFVSMKERGLLPRTYP